MTTWHDSETLDEALWFLLFVTWPDDAYWDGCDAALVVAIGSEPDQLQRIRYALRNPRRFSVEVLDQESFKIHSASELKDAIGIHGKNGKQPAGQGLT